MIHLTSGSTELGGKISKTLQESYPSYYIILGMLRSAETNIHQDLFSDGLVRLWVLIWLNRRVEDREEVYLRAGPRKVLVCRWIREKIEKIHRANNEIKAYTRGIVLLSSDLSFRILSSVGGAIIKNMRSTNIVYVWKWCIISYMFICMTTQLRNYHYTFTISVYWSSPLLTSCNTKRGRVDHFARIIFQYFISFDPIITYSFIPIIILGTFYQR